MIELPGFIVPTLLVLFLLFLAYSDRWYKMLKYKRLPPGPHCLPFLGYLPMINPKIAHVKLQDLANKYGNIFGIYFGGKYTVVIDDFQALKAAYNRDEFLNRPENLLEIEPGQPSVISMNGAVWKNQKRFILNSLRHLGAGNQKYERFLMEQVNDVRAELCRTEGKDVNLNHKIELPINNLMFQLFFNKTFEPGHRLIRLLSEYNEFMRYRMTHKFLSFFFPSLAKVAEFSPQLRKAKEIHGLIDEILRQEILEHQLNLNINEPRDFVDHFLVQMEKPTADPSYSMNVLLGNLELLLAAGSETTRSTVVWFTLLMAKHSDIQKRAQYQIDTVLGRERDPESSLKTQMPFIEAILWEVLRTKSVFTLNLLRCIPKDTTLNGFDIPKDTLVFHNMYSHFRNPKLFPRPEEFDPTRFLSEDGKRVNVPECLTPFSYGKRNCIGEKIGMTTLFLFSTALLQRFDVLPPEGGVCLEMEVATTTMAAKPFARFRVR